MTVREATYSGQAPASRAVHLQRAAVGWGLPHHNPLARVPTPVSIRNGEASPTLPGFASQPKTLLGKPAIGPPAWHRQWALTPENRWKDTNNAQGDRRHEFKKVPDPNGTVVFFSLLAHNVSIQRGRLVYLGRTLLLVALSGRSYM